VKKIPGKILRYDQMSDWVISLKNEYKVFGPVARRKDVSFQEIDDHDDLVLGYKTTTLPPKKFFHRTETLVEYDEEGSFKVPEMEPQEPILLFGVHSCDMNAILKQDRLFSEDYVDTYYQRRRQNSAIIAVTCVEPGENCFCGSLGMGPTIDNGYDLLLTDVGDGYIVEIGSEKGEGMIDGLKLDVASTKQVTEKSERVAKAIDLMPKTIRMEGLSDQAYQSLDHEVWTKIGEEGGLADCFPCLSCGNCSLVCPTCYCYEVADIPSISLKDGVRRRELDSCQLLEYSKVALDHNFRPERKDRTRNWMICKFGGAGGQMNSSCVGCGRCIKACPAHIDLTEVAKSLWGE
jgi:ferredoxin